MSPGTVEPLLLLLLATLVPILAVLMPRFRQRTPLWLRVLWDLAILVVMTFLVRKTLGSPLEPQFATEHSSEQVWQRLVEAGWWIVAARCGVGLARTLVVLENRPRETQIVSDLLAGAIYVATFLAVVNFAFAVPIRGLLATSGVIAIVLGLALQSTLADVFSGIAVGIEKPYGVGDLLWVEGGIEGHVLQVNWRSTQIATAHDNVAIIPNSVMAKARLVNRSAPTPVRGHSLEIRLDAASAPEACVASLTAAAKACRVPIPFPAPGVACTGLHGDGAVYEISFSVAGSRDLGPASTEMLGLIHRHLRFDGIALAVPGLAKVPPVPIPTPSDILAQSDLFGLLDSGERDMLAQHFRPVRLPAGAVLIREDEAADGMFVLASGVAEVTVSDHGRQRVVARMSPGSSLGAIGVITGGRHGATVTALVPLKAYRLDRADISAAIKAHPEIAAVLEELAKRGVEALRADAAAHDDVKTAQPDVLQSRLRALLRLLNS